MIATNGIEILNNKRVIAGRYILYWMRASQRVSFYSPVAPLTSVPAFFMMGKAIMVARFLVLRSSISF
jgi:hypothetical protein